MNNRFYVCAVDERRRAHFRSKQITPDASANFDFDAKIWRKINVRLQNETCRCEAWSDSVRPFVARARSFYTYKINVTTRLEQHGKYFRLCVVTSKFFHCEPEARAWLHSRCWKAITNGQGNQIEKSLESGVRCAFVRILFHRTLHRYRGTHLHTHRCTLIWLLALQLTCSCYVLLLTLRQFSFYDRNLWQFEICRHSNEKYTCQEGK